MPAAMMALCRDRLSKLAQIEALPEARTQCHTPHGATCQTPHAASKARLCCTKKSSRTGGRASQGLHVWVLITLLALPAGPSTSAAPTQLVRQDQVAGNKGSPCLVGSASNRQSTG